MDWNFSKSFNQSGDKPKYLLVADDVIGGYFALNGGSLGDNLGKIYYFSPKDLTWHDLNFTYTDFLSLGIKWWHWSIFTKICFGKIWQEDVKQLEW